MKKVAISNNLWILLIISTMVLVSVTGCIDGEKKNTDIGTPPPEKTPVTVISSVRKVLWKNSICRN